MRALVLALVIAACTPDVAPGSYLCGPEGACPEGQACNGPDNVCVLESGAAPFACAGGTEIEPNDSAQAAQLVVENLGCATREIEVEGCELDDDREDWFAFEVPASCTSVSMQGNLTFPIAFEILALELRAADGAELASAGPCAGEDDEDGEDHRCVSARLTPGTRYLVRVARSGEGACDGQCSHNRYTLNLQLSSP